MKTTRILLGLAMLCGAAFSAPAQTITTTPTNGPTTITIHARTTDGKLPVDVNCTVVTQMMRVMAQHYDGTLPHTMSQPQPLSLVGTNGDWTATNVPPGYYGVDLQSSNYVDDAHSGQLLRVEAGNNYSIDFVSSRGTTFKGRVLDAVTREPIADERIYGSSSTSDRFYDIRTDAEGRYILPHITGPLEIQVTGTSNYYAPQGIQLAAAAGDSTVSVPDIRLQRGGWISGWVERSAGVSNASASVKLELQGSLPTHRMLGDLFFTDTNGAFRTYTLMPGIYTLHAVWSANFPYKGFSQVNGSISGIKVIAGQDTTNVLIPTKMTGSK